MPPPLSAVEAITPAFAHTKRQLFQPFRLWIWARLAVVSLLTGEFAGGSWGGTGNFNVPSTTGGGRKPDEFLSLADPTWDVVREFLPWVVVGVLVVVALGLILLYIASVFRFILFEAVLSDRCGLRQGWRRWQQAGWSYFLWQVGFSLVLTAVLALFVAAPIYLAWRAGLFHEPDKHFGLLLLGGVVLFFLFLGLALLGAVVSLFAKDFVVPLMAMENRGVVDAWQRLLPLLRAEKWAYAGYVLMKIVLALGSAILFGIIGVIVLLVLLFGLGVIGVALVLAGKAAGLTLNVYTIALAILLGVAALGFVFFVVAFVSTPATVFFQAYTLRFFGSRYPRLGEMLSQAWPAPPAASPAIGS